MLGRKRKTEEREEIKEEVYDEKERRSTARFCAVLLAIVAVMLLFLNFWSSNFGLVRVEGRSMDNTLYSGEYLLSYKVVHPEHELKRGDVIVVGVGHIPEWQEKNQSTTKNPTEFIIKRLIGLEGDIVRCTKGKMEICYAGTWEETMRPDEYPFVAVDEPYAYYDEREGGVDAPCNTFEYTVGEGEIFFLGDNRNHSRDSRYLQEGYSELDRLYKIDDVTAVVTDWALKHQKGLEKYLVKIPSKIKNFITKPFKKLKG